MQLSTANSLGRNSPEADNEETNSVNNLEATNEIISPEANNEQTEGVNDSQINMEATNDNDAYDIFSPEIILTEGVDLMSTSNQTDNEDDNLEETNLSRQQISTSTPRARRGPSFNITNSLSSIRRRDNEVSKII